MSASSLFTKPEPTFPQTISGGSSIQLVAQPVSVVVNNTPYEDVLTSATLFNFPTGTTRVRLTYSVNCSNGLGNNEHLIMYGGLRIGGTDIIGSCFTDLKPLVSSSVAIGGGAYISTCSFVDYVDIPTTIGLRPILYMRVASGSHSVDLDVYVSAEPY